MKFLSTVFSFIFIITSFLLFYASPVFADLDFGLIPPSGTLTRGQDVTFIVNLDTQGAKVTSTQIGMTYDPQYLEYISTTPGDAMTTIDAVPSENNLIISGSNSEGFTGSGVYAYVTFKIIATTAGSTEICQLYNVTTTPTPAPTSAPVPTELPKSGIGGNTQMLAITGTILLLSSAASFLILKRSKSINPYKNN